MAENALGDLDDLRIQRWNEAFGSMVGENAADLKNGAVERSRQKVADVIQRLLISVEAFASHSGNSKLILKELHPAFEPKLKVERVRCLLPVSLSSGERVIVETLSTVDAQKGLIARFMKKSLPALYQANVVVASPNQGRGLLVNDVVAWSKLDENKKAFNFDKQKMRHQFAWYINYGMVGDSTVLPKQLGMDRKNVPYTDPKTQEGFLLDRRVNIGLEDGDMKVGTYRPDNHPQSSHPVGNYEYVWDGSLVKLPSQRREDGFSYEEAVNAELELLTHMVTQAGF